jgi:hypothetical protein
VAAYELYARGRALEIEPELAFRSVTEADAFGPWFLTWPGAEALRSHPRYPELRRLIGL